VLRLCLPIYDYFEDALERLLDEVRAVTFLQHVNNII
jgi:hypothetical protein